MYGIEELSDTDGEEDMQENPMSPEQIARMRESAAPSTRGGSLISLTSPACAVYHGAQLTGRLR